MTANYLPWLVLLAIVAVSLVFKGYVKLPGAGRSQQPAPQGQTMGHAVTNKPPVIADLEFYDSRTLAFYLSLASRREAERAFANQVADQAVEAAKAAHSAPFSAPAPAGQTQPPASAPQ